MTDTQTTTTVEQLRAAVHLLDKRAHLAAEGPWTCSPVWSPDSTSTSAVYSSAYPTGTTESEIVGGCLKGRGNGGIRDPHNAVYIAMMQPRVALAQANLLREVLLTHDLSEEHPLVQAALNVAHAVLGESDD